VPLASKIDSRDDLRGDYVPTLKGEIEQLRQELAELKQEFWAFKKKFD
jgi:hypothetical protein